MRKIGLVVVLLLLLAACAATPEELRSSANKMGLSTEDSSMDGEVLVLRLNDKCDGRLLYDPLSSVLYLSIWKRGGDSPLAVPADGEIEPFVTQFNAKKADSNRPLDVSVEGVDEVRKSCFGVDQ